MNFGFVVPFAEHLGFVLHSAREGTSEIRYVPSDVHLNSHGVVHGGVLMTLLDVTMAMASHSVAGQGRSVVTIEMKTCFMMPARGALEAKGRVVHSTRSLSFVEAQVLDLDGKACAAASGTFKYVSAGPRS